MLSKMRYDTTVLDRIADLFDTKAEHIMEALAFESEALAKQLAAYDTGAMSNSIYTKTKRSDEFNAASAAALARNPDVETNPLPALSGNVVAVMGPCVEYGIYVELGTSRMGARPFVLPGVTGVFGKFGLPYTWQEAFE